MKRSLLFASFIIAALCASGISIISCADSVQADTSRAIPFIHKTHVDNYGISDCVTCHGYDEIGRFKGLPTVGDCTACHARDGKTGSKDHMAPRKKTMFDSYTDRDMPWAHRSKKPDLVYYSHKVVMSGKSDDIRLKSRCVMCHGDKADPNGVATMQGKPLMNQCIGCHEDFSIVNQCIVCH